MNPSRLGLSRRLALAFAVLTALMLAIAATAVVQMRAMDGRRADITDNWLPSVESVNQMRALLAEKGVTVEGSWFFADGREIGQLRANWRAEHAVFRLSR